MFYLYKITCLVNQKVYIGQTVQPEKRWYQHKNDSVRNPKVPFHHAIKKYGNENFIFEVIACCKSQDDANYLEELLIQQYDCFISNGKGYNSTYGGMNAPKSDKWKQLMSDKFTGRNADWAKKENISPENLISKQQHGKQNWDNNPMRLMTPDASYLPPPNVNHLLEWRKNNPDKVTENRKKVAQFNKENPNSGQFRPKLLTDEQIIAIKQDIASVSSIARKFFISRERVKQLKGI